jgi:hypothetical protein
MSALGRGTRSRSLGWATAAAVAFLLACGSATKPTQYCFCAVTFGPGWCPTDPACCPVLCPGWCAAGGDTVVDGELWGAVPCAGYCLVDDGGQNFATIPCDGGGLCFVDGGPKDLTLTPCGGG